MNSFPIRLGIVGCGNVLAAYAASIDRLRLDNVEVTMACGRASQKDSACALLRTSRFTTNPEEVIHSDSVDAVLVLTSMNQHATLAVSALEAGKHVLVEKPFATTLEDADRVVSVARRATGYLVCAPFTTLSPTFQTIGSRIRNGDIGQPCSARARYGWSGPWWSEWFYKAGGGCLNDLGIYCLTSLTGLLGPVQRVMAMTGVAIPVREISGRQVKVSTEDNAQVLLDFGNSTLAVVTTGFTIQQYRGPALEVYGKIGTIQMLGDDWDPDGYEIWQNSVGAWQVYKETAPDWSWTAGLRHLVECIRNGRPPVITPEHARHVLEIVVRAQQSGREGRALLIESRFEPPAFLSAAPMEAAYRVHDRTH